MAGPRQCSVCDVRLQACWPFRADDRHCSLCGLRILRLVVSPTAPDGAVWLYRTPREPLLLHLGWERGLDARPAERTPLRPVLEFRACRARFGGERGPRLEFRLEETGDDGPGETITARLVPCFEGFDRLELPPHGIAGELVIASAAGTETRPALLLPHGREPLLECVDPSVSRRDGVWRIYRHGAAAVPMRLTVPVAQWLLRVGRNTEPESEHEVALGGLQTPVLIEPDKQCLFELRVDGSDWHTLGAKPFSFLADRIGLPPLPLAGRLALVPGSRLQFGDGTVRAVEVRLGRKAIVSVAVTVTDAAVPRSLPMESQQEDEEFFPLEIDKEGELAASNIPTVVRESGVTVTDCTVQQGPVGATWLQVVKPRREQLPWDLPASVPGQPAAHLELEVDTTALDRERFHGAVLRGAVELVDSRHRRWRCEVQANVTRPARLASYVAIDWGTTNSCAAYRKGVGPGDEPLSISFDEEQREAPELFPSDMYFEYIGDPQNPVFHLGNDAVRKARKHPECCLRSVKRKFQFCERVSVMDERGRCHDYTTAELARLLLRRLIALAEATLGQEIHNLALTYPTKWSARVRDKLEGVTNALAADLGRERAPYSVAVLPPSVDEATAVALNFITSDHGRADLPETFHLIAYDFGGGTVDTAVLAVSLPHDTGAVRTRYVGLGGRGDFGGDDVTRAAMGCLRDRIADALRRRPVVLDAQTQRTARLLDLPLVADGAPLRGDLNGAAHGYQLGRKNWDALWKIAELIKIDLCDGDHPPPAATRTRPAGAPPQTDTDFGASLVDSMEQDEQVRQAWGDRHPVADRLRPRLAEVLCRVVIQPGPVEAGAPSEVVWALDAVLDPLDADSRDAFFRELPFTLEEVCDYPLADVYESNAGRPYTVRQRVDDTVRELEAQCRDRGVAPDVIVLAGGGCRLPLVAETMRRYFPADRELLLYSKDFAKRRVAHGMASYLALRQVIDLDRQLARSVETVHQPLGVQRLVVEGRVARSEFVSVVPVGAPLDGDAAVFPFEFTAAQLRAGPAGGACLTLFVRDWHKGARAFGSFDLGRPAGLGSAARAVPVLPGATYAGELRLRGARRVELVVVHEGATYGPFVLAPAVADAEALLQGEEPASAALAARP